MKKLLLIFTFALSISVYSNPMPNFFEGVRPTGMGNAFLAIADDANTLWYNPAGLSEIQGFHFNLFDFALGFDSVDTLSRIQRAVFKGKTSDLLREDQEYIRFNFMPSMIMPHFGISLFSQTQGLFDLSDIIHTGLQAHSFHDQGAIAGAAFSLTDFLSFGFSLRAFYRSGIDFSLTAQDVIDKYGANANTLLDNIYQELSNEAGQGYAFGLNAGVRIQVPLKSKGPSSPKLFLAATAEDIGNTTFHALDGHAVPVTLKQQFNFGGALIYPFAKNWSWNLAADMRNALEPTDFVRLFHIGTEIRQSNFGLRVGANQGYLTYGFSLEFPPHTRLHFSSYGIELGNKRWEKEQRLYLLQLNIGFNPN
jgi:hypothetical protein